MSIYILRVRLFRPLGRPLLHIVLRLRSGQCFWEILSEQVLSVRAKRFVARWIKEEKEGW